MQSTLKSLPDTRLSKHSSIDNDSGISNSFHTSGRWQNARDLSASFSSPMSSHDYHTSKPPLSHSPAATSLDSPANSLNLSYSGAWDRLGKSYDASLPMKNGTTGTHELKTSVSPSHHVTPASQRNGYSNGVHYTDSSSSRHSKPTTSKYGSLDRAKSKSANVLDLQSQLEESEKRRQLLVDKLKDARGTIQHQCDRLEDTECGFKKTSFSLDEYKHREKEYKKKIEVLEQDKIDYQNKRLDSLKQREALQERIGGLENEIGLLKTSCTLMESESKAREDVIKQSTTTMGVLEDENNKLSKMKESLGKEVSALKESLDIARSRNEWLENQTQDNRGDLDRLRKESQHLLDENRTVQSQISELRESNLTLKEENATHLMALKQLHQDKLMVQRQIDTYHDSMADLKANLASVTSDKERYFQEKLDLHQKLQTAMLDRDAAIKEKSVLDEQVNELNAEVAQVKLQTDRHRDDSRKIKDETAAVKKVGEVLSIELATTKANLEKVMEHNQSLEQSKKLAFQQHSLYEQEIRSLESQLDNMRKSMDSLRDSHSKEREGIDSGTLKLREELRHAKSERNQMELKVHELEAKLKRQTQEEQSELRSSKTELETWRNSCEKMTASLSRKEMEVQQLSRKLQQLEKEAGYLKMNEQSLQGQAEDLMEVKQENLRLQSENHRLLQERDENQQVIQLLEMQKNILAKTSENSLVKAQDSSQLESRIALLTSENQSYLQKIQQLEKIREDLIREKEERLASGDLYFPTSGLPHSQAVDSVVSSASVKQIQELEKQNKQLRDVNTTVTDQMTRLEKENVLLRSKQSESSASSVAVQAEAKRLEVEKQNAEEDLQHVRQQYKQLEERHHKLIADKDANRGTESDIARLRSDKESLEQRVASLENEITWADRGKKRATDKVESLEAEIQSLQSQVSHGSKEQSREVNKLHKQIAELQAELNDAKNIQGKQDNLIQSLKDELEDEKNKKPHRIKVACVCRQSLDDVGSELTVMRQELQKLMGVIKMKDQEIQSLGTQLETSKKEVTHRGRDDLQEHLATLKEEKEELSRERDSLQQELEKHQAEVSELSTHLEQVEAAHGEEVKRLQDRLRRELAGKDRQIESLEEQLRRNTSAEIRRLKREASKVELLKQENRRLMNERSRLMGQPLKQESTTDQNDSWEDSDEVGLHNGLSADVLGNSALSAGVLESVDVPDGSTRHREEEEDEDVRKVVAMLENVQFNDTMGLSLPEGEGNEKEESNKTYTLSRDYGTRKTNKSHDNFDDRDYSSRENGVRSDSPVETSRNSRGYDYSNTNGHEETNGRTPVNRTPRKSGFRSFPSPTVTTESPKRSSSTNYRLTSENGSPRPQRRTSRSRSPSYSPPRSYERSRSYDRSSNRGLEPSYERSRSYDRRASGRSYDHNTTTGYGSLSSSVGLRNSFSTDINSKSLPDGGQRYRSSLAELGPTPGESKDERRRRMKELLRTLDKSPRP